MQLVYNLKPTPLSGGGIGRDRKGESDALIGYLDANWGGDCNDYLVMYFRLEALQ